MVLTHERVCFFEKTQRKHVIDVAAENNIVVTLGANLEMSPALADANASLIGRSRMVICQGEIDEKGNRRAFEIAREHGVTTFLNPAPGDANMDKTILSLVDIICTNENEVRSLQYEQKCPFSFRSHNTSPSPFPVSPQFSRPNSSRGSRKIT